jgi:hypothetical protein
MRYGRRAATRVALPLQPPALEEVDVKTMVLGLAAVAGLAFAGGSLITASPVTTSRSYVTAPELLVTPTSRDGAPDDAVDAYGNEVTDAVAQYTLDGAGTLYELHSPQVELPRLGSPKS